METETARDRIGARHTPPKMTDPSTAPLVISETGRILEDPTDRRCERIYRDTGRQCWGRIEWWRRADALYCSPRCKRAARDQRAHRRRKAKADPSHKPRAPRPGYVEASPVT